MAAGKKDAGADVAPEPAENDEQVPEEVIAEVIEDEDIEAVEGEAVESEDAPAEDAPAEDAAAEDAPADDADADDAEPDIFEAIKSKAADLQKENADLRDKFARLQAEWDNYRKRTAAERSAERVRAAESLVKDLLPVIDDLERAVAHAKESGDGGSLTEGVDAIMGKMLQILGKHKVEQVEAQGEPFDAMRHQAVGTQEDQSVPEETVVQVYQQGYRMGDRILRPAMVVTSTGGPQREPDEPDTADEQ